MQHIEGHLKSFIDLHEKLDDDEAKKLGAKNEQDEIEKFLNAKLSDRSEASPSGPHPSSLLLAAPMTAQPVLTRPPLWPSMSGPLHPGVSRCWWSTSLWIKHSVFDHWETQTRDSFRVCSNASNDIFEIQMTVIQNNFLTVKPDGTSKSQRVKFEIDSYYDENTQRH